MMKGQVMAEKVITPCDLLGLMTVMIEALRYNVIVKQVLWFANQSLYNIRSSIVACLLILCNHICPRYITAFLNFALTSYLCCCPFILVTLITISFTLSSILLILPSLFTSSTSLECFHFHLFLLIVEHTSTFSGGSSHLQGLIISVLDCLWFEE